MRDQISTVLRVTPNEALDTLEEALGIGLDGGCLARCRALAGEVGKPGDEQQDAGPGRTSWPSRRAQRDQPRGKIDQS